MTDFDAEEKKKFGDRYEIQRKIARGGMADVYLAQDQLLDRPVALKVLFPELSVDPNFVERFRREAQNAAKLSHPNIVSVYDWGEESSTYFIVMEYIDGQTLSNIIREEGPQPAERAAKIGSDVASALSFAHRNGVVHRDVKPGNVLIDNNGLVKVTDFGIARARNSTENLTQTGAVMGTATYFSPEQAQGLHVDERSDVYSLGVVLYEVVAGKPPFQGDNPVTIAYKHVRETPTPLKEVNRTIPDAYAAIVNKAMAKSANLRYSTAEDLRSDLERFQRGQGVKAAPVPATSAYGANAYADSTRTIPAVPIPREPVRPAPETTDRRIAGPLMLLLSLIAIIVIAIIVFVNLGSPSGSNAAVTIPNVVGKTKAEATSILTQLKLHPTFTQQADKAPVDQVLSQNPAANTAAHENDTVQVTISSGPSPITLSDYTGQTLNEAQSELRALGFKVSVVQQASDTVAKDTVISQDPAANTESQAGATVTLTVSSGPAQIAVPDVAGFTRSSAAQKLSDAGLRTSYPPDMQSSDIVASTNPTAGTPVASGTTINLVPQVTTTTSTSTTSTTAKQTTTTTTQGN